MLQVCTEPKTQEVRSTHNSVSQATSVHIKEFLGQLRGPNQDCFLKMPINNCLIWVQEEGGKESLPKTCKIRGKSTIQPVLCRRLQQQIRALLQSWLGEAQMRNGWSDLEYSHIAVCVNMPSLVTVKSINSSTNTSVGMF